MNYVYCVALCTSCFILSVEYPIRIRVSACSLTVDLHFKCIVDCIAFCFWNGLLLASSIWLVLQFVLICIQSYIRLASLTRQRGFCPVGSVVTTLCARSVPNSVLCFCIHPLKICLTDSWRGRDVCTAVTVAVQWMIVCVWSTCRISYKQNYTLFVRCMFALLVITGSKTFKNDWQSLNNKGYSFWRGVSEHSFEV